MNDYKPEDLYEHAVITAYCAAVRFTECHIDSDELSETSDLSPEAHADAAREVRLFLEAAKPVLDEITHTAERVGHDFWLTRQGHGAGFWDGDWPEEIGEKLTALAEQFGQVDCYACDDGSGSLMFDRHHDFKHTVQDWRDEVLRGHILSGYYDWLESMIEQEGDGL